MTKKLLTIIATCLILSLASFGMSANAQSLGAHVQTGQGTKQIAVTGEQHGINYQVFRGNSKDHYVIRFYKEGETPLNARITDLQVDLEIVNGTLLSVAPAGQIDGNKSSYKFSSRRGLNNQLEDKGLFLIFKFNPESNSSGTLSFAVTEYTQLTRTSSTKESELIIFSLQ